ncbi:hypothetical protein [Streptomyces sp. NPDC002346]
MGQSTDAILAYGYVLPEGVEYDVDGLDPDSDDYEGFDEEAGKKLQAAGITGVHITRHCSHDYPMYLLTTCAKTAWRGGPRFVDVDYVNRAPVEGGWDVKLSQALEVLGVTPESPRVGWLFCSDWS